MGIVLGASLANGLAVVRDGRPGARPPVPHDRQAVVETRTENDSHGSPPLLPGIIGGKSSRIPSLVAVTVRLREPPAAVGQDRDPEAQKRRDAREHHDRPAGVVVERPRAEGMHQSPGKDAGHDPAEDAFGSGWRG